MTLKLLILFVVTLAAVVCWGCGCIKPEPLDDITSVDTVVPDSLIDSSELDAVGRDMPLDGAGDSGPDDICGPVDADPIHVVGQPCEVEGESYCMENGSYSKLIPDFLWQCIRPGFVKCSPNSANGSLTWQNFDCEEDLAPLGQECGFPVITVNCVQKGKATVCCPWTARTYSAGRGVICSHAEIGRTRCGEGNYLKGGGVRTCNYLREAQTTYPKEPGSGGPASDKCDKIFAECPYWYYSELCPTQEFCHHPTACESGINEYGEPTNICAGACIYDTDQGVARCAKTCDDLFNYYID